MDNVGIKLAVLRAKGRKAEASNVNTICIAFIRYICPNWVKHQNTPKISSIFISKTCLVCRGFLIKFWNFVTAFPKS